MNKRNSSANLHTCSNASGRRSSVDDLRLRAINIVHRNPGVTIARPSPSNDGVSSNAAKQRESRNVSVIRKSSVNRKETTMLPKTRFDLAHGWRNHTPGFEHLPVESVRKTVASESYSPLSLHNIAIQNMCERVAGTSMGTNADTCASNLPNQEYGDTLKLRPVDVLVQQQQQAHQIQQSSEQAGTMGQRQTPTQQDVNRINQSEAMLNGRLQSAKQSHRPCVPVVVHGMPLKNMTPRKLAISLCSPAQQSHPLCAEERQQSPRNHASFAAAEHMQPTQTSVRQHASQITGESTADELRTKVPREVDDTSNVCDYELRPVVGRNANAGYRASSSNERLAAHQRDVVDVPRTGSAQSPCEARSVQPGVKDMEKHTHQRQLGQGHHHLQLQPQQSQQQQGQVNQGLSRVGFDYSRQSLQNARQMYQQFQNNMVSQQKIQRRALECQQQIRAMIEQQVGQRPLAHESKITVQQANRNRKSGDNEYNLQEIYTEQSRNSSQDIHANKITIPHYQMLMQQQNAGYGSSCTIPQHSWMSHRSGIGHDPSFHSRLKQFTVEPVPPEEEKNISWNNMKQCEQAKQIEASSMENETLSQQQGTPYSQYEETMYRCLPVQHVRESSNPLSYQQCPPVQQIGQGCNPVSRSSAIQHRSQQQSEINEQVQAPGSHQVLETAKKKYPEFTSEMIRDQELLVANMRQQHIPENLMRRQFDALLSEQRRHLAYFGGQDRTKGMSDDLPRRRFALHEDQRPGWMENITPAQYCADDGNQQGSRGEQRPYHTVYQLVNGVTPRSPLNFPYVFHIPHCQKAGQLQKQEAYNKRPAIGLEASTPCTKAALPHAVSPSQGTWSWSQQNYGPTSGPQCISVRCDDLQSRSPRQVQPQESFQRRYEQPYEITQPQRMHYTQQQQQQPMSSVRRQTRQGICITHEQHQQPDKVTVAEKGNEKCDNASSQELNEAWSLLKLRKFRKYVRPQRQNNGLQDAETVKAALEAFKTSETRKGFEYVANLEKNVINLKLNGTQNPSASENFPQPPVEYLQRLQERQQPKISSNGLYNTRNINNPAPAPISFPSKTHPSPMAGYPRQNYAGDKTRRVTMAPSTHKMIAEKENGSVADRMQQDRIQTVSTGCDRSVRQYLPSRSDTRVQYLPWQSGSINDPCQWTTIPCDAKESISPQGVTTIAPYKFEGSDPLYLQQSEQFYRNQSNLRTANHRGVAVSTQQPGTLDVEMALVRELPTGAENTIQFVASCADPNTSPDHIHRQKCCLTRAAMAKSTNKPYSTTRMVGNEETVPSSLAVQHTTTDSNHGQPEIREARTIGGLVYLARDVDYIQNPQLIAPNAWLASKFLQPLVSSN